MNRRNAVTISAAILCALAVSVTPSLGDTRARTSCKPAKSGLRCFRRSTPRTQQPASCGRLGRGSCPWRLRADLPDASESRCSWSDGRRLQGRGVRQDPCMRRGHRGYRAIAGGRGGLFPAGHPIRLYLSGAGWFFDSRRRRCGPARDSHRGCAQSRLDLRSAAHREAQRAP
jgi:hypothetical protein